VWLRISVCDETLIVEVSDNGRGFDPHNRSAGADGIVNMEERLKALGGECEIRSNGREGTTVQFRAPLPETFI
jgi:signal transduction histidine kinase